jgi:hypothetical protein
VPRAACRVRLRRRATARLTAEVIAGGNCCSDCRRDNGPIGLDLFIAETQYAIAQCAKKRVPAPILFKLFRARVERCTVDFDNEPFAEEEINVSDSLDLHLLANAHSASMSVELEE